MGLLSELLISHELRRRANSNHAVGSRSTLKSENVALTPVERLLVDYVSRGERLDLAVEDPVDKDEMRSWDDSRTIRASVLRDILRGRLVSDPDPHGLQLREARITGRVDLEYLTSSIIVELLDCFLVSGIIVSDAHLPFLSLEGSLLEHPAEPALYAARFSAGALFLDGTTIIASCENGAARLAGARLGQLDVVDAVLRNSSGPALNAEGVRVEEVLYLERLDAMGADLGGAVVLDNSHLGGLNCCKASLHNDSGPALSARALRVDHDADFREFTAVGGGADATVNLSGMRIDGSLVFNPAKLEAEESSKAVLDLDGLTYSGLLIGISSGEWLSLLRNGTPAYAAQPYQHLAAAHLSTGQDDEARRILIAQRKDQIYRLALTGRAERAWARFTGWTLGYGYQPWRALIGLIIVITAAIVLTVTVGGHGGLVRAQSSTLAASRCSMVEQVGIGLDISLPLINTGAQNYCDVSSSTAGQVITAAGWGLQLLAWAFAALFVAGFTGAVRKA